MLLILAAVSGVLIYGMVAALLGTILPELSKRLQLTPKQMGRIALSQALGLVLASIVVGPLIGLAGKKIALVVALAIVTFGLLSLPRSKSFGTVASMLFVIGFGGGIIVAGANSLTADMGAGMSEMTKTNLLNSFFGLGGLLTPFIAANLFKGDSAKLLNLIAALAGVSLVLCAVGPVPGPVGSGDAFGGAGAVLATGAFWLVSLLFFLYIACEVGVWNWLVQHLVAQGLPEKSALNVLSLGFALGLLLGRLLIVPFLPKDLSPVQVTLGAGVLMALTTYGMLQVRSATAAAAAVFIGGLAMAPVFPNAIAITNMTFQSNPTALGLALVFGWMGLAVSSPIIGALGGHDTRRLKTALLVLPVMSILIVGVSALLLGKN
ncbi:MAG: MFS transporter [Bryobacteraceae bacterium]|nr:MFS transporter [Bryobacteraceae bacterium]MDW8378754.1 MFS transporter [Bryobacterales bacterium]